MNVGKDPRRAKGPVRRLLHEVLPCTVDPVAERRQAARDAASVSAEQPGDPAQQRQQVHDHLNELVLDLMNKLATGQLPSGGTDQRHAGDRRAQRGADRQAGAAARRPEGAGRHRRERQGFRRGPCGGDGGRAASCGRRASRTTRPAGQSPPRCSAWRRPTRPPVPPRRAASGFWPRD